MPKQHDGGGLFSFPLLLLFIVGVFLLAPLFNDLPLEGNVIAPPPPPPAPGEEGAAGDDELPGEPLAPGETLPDEPALLGSDLPDEPSAPGASGSESGASTDSSSSQSSDSRSSGSGGKRSSPESSVRGGSSGSGGGSGSRGTAGGGVFGSTATPSGGSSSPSAGVSPIPVQTTPPAQTQVVSPLVRQQPTPQAEETSVWVWTTIGVFAALFIAAIVFLILHLRHVKVGRLFEEQLMTPIRPGQQAVTPLPMDDPEIQEINEYLSENMGKGYPLDALSDALVKNGFVKDKVKQVADYLRQSQSLV